MRCFVHISQKCQYGLRAVLELARHRPGQPVRIADIAEAQAIPVKFLEVILAELKRGGFVESRRGIRGGYLLRGRPSEVTVGEVVEFIDGPIGPVECISEPSPANCALDARCAFRKLWQDVRGAVKGVFDHTTFQTLLDRMEQEQTADMGYYSI
jgi:Rrf2 family protein